MGWFFRIILGLIILIGVALGLSYIFLADPDVPHEVLIQKYGQPPSQFVTLSNGATVHFRDQGNPDGPALLLLHGSNASLHTWEPWVKILGDQFRIVTVDLPGHGLTGPVPGDDYTMDGMVKFVDAFAEKTGLRLPSLGGNSMGGAIAIKYAQTFPTRVKSLILIDSGGIYLPTMTPPPGMFIATTPVLRDITRALPTRPIYEAAVKEIFVDQRFVTPELIDRYWELNRGPGMRDVTRKRFSVPWETLVAEAKAIEAALPAMGIRTLILWGRNDKVVPMAAGEVFRDKIPGAKMIDYDGVGHTPQEEAADKSAADVRAFLAVSP